MNQQPICGACRRRPTRDTRTLCDQCQWEIRRALTYAADLARELTTTIARQTRIPAANGPARVADTDPIPPGRVTGGARAMPLPYNHRASTVLDELHATLARWYAAMCPGGRAAGLAAHIAWLLEHLDQLAIRDDAARAHRHITGIAAPPSAARPGLGWATVDHPPERAFIGICSAKIDPPPDAQVGDGDAAGGVGHYECRADLYATHGETVAVCPDCGARHNVEQRRDILWNALHDVLMTVAEIVSWGQQLGHITERDTRRIRRLLDKWVQRGRIAPHATDAHGHGLYPFGETLTAAITAPTRKAG